ncbi:hypothetical protein D3C87_777470 [compost metagenome]
MTHAELVELAAEWLWSKCSVVITEMVSVSVTMECPDAIGWYSHASYLVECKASRADFLADRKKVFRQSPEHGMGTYRYFLAARGVIKPEELPANWGLLEVSEGGKVRTAVKSSPQPSFFQAERDLLLSALRRVGKAIPDGAGVSVKYYTRSKAKGTATMGVAMD